MSHFLPKKSVIFDTMFARFCIFSLILIGAATVLSVRAAGPGTHAPDRFTPDSARVANPDATA